MKNISQPALIANDGFAVFFDNVRVDQFVKDYSVSMGVDASIGTAVINMIYVPDFDKVIHDYNSSSISSISDQAAKATPVQQTQVTETVQKAEVVNCWHLTIRQGPGMETPAIAWVDAGDILPVHGRGGADNYWVKVTSTNGKTGWTGSRYLRIFNETKTKTVTTGGNSGSSSSSQLAVGSKVKIHGTRYATGQTIPGWVKEREHTIMQIGSGKVLLREIYSWVYTSDVTLVGAVATPKTTNGDSTVQDGLTATLDDGIEYMTNVRIFVKNIFNGKYVQIFGGNITSKSTTYTGSEKTLTFQCQDFMNWLTRTICPIAVPFDGTLQVADRLKWKAQGIDLDKVRSVNSIKDVTFKGKTLSQTWQIIADQTIKANKIYSSSDTVSAWDNALDRVVVMGDIDESLRKAEVVDFMITTSVTQMNSTYVMMNDILRTLMFEFYQDRDETIRIKPPFWNEHVLRNHVIDPTLILSFTESTNYTQMYTRVIATGGLEEWHRTEGADDFTTSLLTPVVVYTSSGITANSGPVVVTSSTTSNLGGGVGSNIATAAVAVAKQYIGVPYLWGGASPSGFDCSGLIYYAYQQAGYTGWTCRETTYTLLAKGRRVASANDLKPGDLLFPHSGHVYMYIGNNQVIHAPDVGQTVKIANLSPSQYAHDMRRYVEWDGTGNTSSTEYVKPESVGPNTLLAPTYIEKKYGPLIYDASQPLIKFSTSGATNSTSAYDALSKYARFMLNYLNSSVTMSSLQTVAMPWLRPGFNIWVDPVRTDKIFYINNISHYGNASGNFTNLNVTLGRRRVDFVNKKNMVGSLNPGKSDDVFVNKLKVTPEHFGTPCNYNEVVDKVNAFYNDNDSNVKQCTPTDPYFKYLYDSDGGSKYSETVSTTTTAPASKPTIIVGSVVKLHGTKYATGQTIPAWVKERNHTVMQIGTGKILLKEIYSWVYSSDVTLVSGGGVSTASTKSSSSSTGTVYNTGGLGLVVRSGPSRSYAQIGSLWDGNTVSIIKSQDGWLNINHNGNTNAWVSANYVKTTTASSPVPTSQDPTSKYASHSTAALIPSEATLSEIQNILNNKYGSAPNVVKERKNRLANIVNSMTPYLKNLYAGTYTENPININTGTTS